MSKTGQGLISYLGKSNMIFNVPTHVPRPKCPSWGRFAWFNSLIEDNLAKSFHFWRIKQTLVNYSLWSLWLCELVLILQHRPRYHSKKMYLSNTTVPWLSVIFILNGCNQFYCMITCYLEKIKCESSCCDSIYIIWREGHLGHRSWSSLSLFEKKNMSLNNDMTHRGIHLNEISVRWFSFLDLWDFKNQVFRNSNQCWKFPQVCGSKADNFSGPGSFLDFPSILCLPLGPTTFLTEFQTLVEIVSQSTNKVW